MTVETLQASADGAYFIPSFAPFSEAFALVHGWPKRIARATGLDSAQLREMDSGHFSEAELPKVVVFRHLVPNMLRTATASWMDPTLCHISELTSCCRFGCGERLRKVPCSNG